MNHCPICFSPDWKFFANTFDRILTRSQEQWQIRRCSACEFGWTVPSLDEERLAPYYSDSYLGDTAKTIREFSSGILQKSRSWRREVEKVQLVEGFIGSGRILDVGCGDAKFLWALDSKRWERIGVDRAREALTLVRSKIPAIKLVEGNIFSEELHESSFDVITLWHVFEHLPNPRRVLSRINELLRPGGWLFLSLPNFVSFQAQLFGRHWYSLDAPRHLWHFGPPSLEILLKENNMRLWEHRFFSRMVNIHSLKYSLIYWSEEYFGNRVPYYLLKPLLLTFPWVERFSDRYGTLTTISRRPHSVEELHLAT